jgi:enoyl-[acyl-carrier-protein] reductase (NADH)
MGEHQELTNLASYLMSDYSSYINGEVVTIDGGEWLQGAGQFNQMESITKDEWDILEKIIRSNQKKS